MNIEHPILDAWVPKGIFMDKRGKKRSYLLGLGLKYWVFCILNCLLTIAYLMFVYNL